MSGKAGRRIKRPLPLLRAMIAGVVVATVTIVACAIALTYSPAEVVTVSAGVATILLGAFLILWLVNRRRLRDPNRSRPPTD